ncbi:uncharacterized protein LOC100680127 [Nasonia vitripennis]|uniref:Uncharacterized protein n=1 Tax=Nasonia vitripennis TaxID=7425 RepID=A0A7M7Q659_NASVI|nr:uncharacterized protein LOC100680127 [Nasonia vitripennis]XP_031780928.1 uncharacterized protein LOC100680127 [Nasonia vitripennis]
MNETSPVTTAGQYIAEFFEDLERTTGFRPHEFQPEALRKRLRQTLNDLYRLNLGRSALQHIMSICRFIVRVYQGEDIDLERSVETFVDVLNKYVMALKSMFLLQFSLFLIDESDQNMLKYVIAAMFFVFDFLCNKLIIKSADMLKRWLPILLRACWNVATEFYSRFSDLLFIGRAMIAA